jgi:hypothetical protein
VTHPIFANFSVEDYARESGLAIYENEPGTAIAKRHAKKLGVAHLLVKRTPIVKIIEANFPTFSTKPQRSEDEFWQTLHDYATRYANLLDPLTGEPIETLESLENFVEDEDGRLRPRSSDKGPRKVKEIELAKSAAANYHEHESSERCGNASVPDMDVLELILMRAKALIDQDKGLA